MGVLYVLTALTVFIVSEARYAVRVEYYDVHEDRVKELKDLNRRSETPEHIPKDDNEKDEGQRGFEDIYGGKVGIPLHGDESAGFLKSHADIEKQLDEDAHLDEKIASIFRKLKGKTDQELISMHRRILEAKLGNTSARSNLEIDGIPLNLKDEEFARRNERNMYDELADEIDLHRRGGSLPTSYGMDVNMLADSIPSKAVRPGQATDTDSCNKVTAVPAALRKDFKPKGIHTFYQKYTEAYGIPILGSKHVSDEGLRSACYIVRYMFADRFDMRNCYYQLWGRVAIIADNEQTTSLVEYSHYSKSYDERTRGVGATLSIPMCSAGDDNVCCKPGDRYFDQCILNHEMLHGQHQLGASYVLPGFENRLANCFETMVEKAGKWKGTYAAENRNEYLATAGQFFFGCFNVPGKYETTYKVKDKASLKVYDKCVYALLEEMYPCGNTFVKRCDWKKCDIKHNYELVYDISVKAKCDCEEIKCTYKLSDGDSCGNYGCYFGGNVINYKNGVCRAMKCDSTKTNADMKLTQSSGEYNIYKIAKQPNMDFSEQMNQNLKTDCTVGVQALNKRSLGKRGKKKGGKNKGGGSNDSGSGSKSGVCDNIAGNNICGHGTKDPNLCKARGCCWDGKQCRYGNPRCVNRDINCPKLARDQCSTDRGYMYSNCALACGVCDKLKTIDQSTIDGWCQNKEANCWPWEKIGECQKNPNFMSTRCPFSCKKCK